MNKIKKAAIFLATGYEVGEAVITIDLLRRAGIDLDLVSINEESLITSNVNVKIQVDKKFKEINFNDYSLLILPGGSLGTDNLYKNKALCEQIKIFAQNQEKMVAAICAAPQILGKLNLLDNQKVSYYPGCDQGLDKAIKTHNCVSVSSNIITGKSIGCVFNFALTIIENFLDNDNMLNVKNQLQF